MKRQIWAIIAMALASLFGELILEANACDKCTAMISSVDDTIVKKAKALLTAKPALKNNLIIEMNALAATRDALIKKAKTCVIVIPPPRGDVRIEVGAIELKNAYGTEYNFKGGKLTNATDEAIRREQERSDMALNKIINAQSWGSHVRPEHFPVYYAHRPNVLVYPVVQPAYYPTRTMYTRCDAWNRVVVPLDVYENPPYGRAYWSNSYDYIRACRETYGPYVIWELVPPSGLPGF